MYSAEQYSSCPQALMALNYNWSAMTTLVNNMSPGGNTNQAIGLQLGWQSLVGGGPFGTVPAKNPNYDYKTIIILLTDGLNTQDRWYSNASSIECATPERALSSPILSIAARNFWRSSALSIASASAPIILTPYFFRVPSWKSDSAVLSAV